ncbi:hypothetical protein F2Q69_00030873 [Brassica cretica]|uniref:Flavodoxin-like domain-containing protein n=1 Tax=Brassica cretica TaxID=69181 RepID=A0A8S9S4K6_BRACR|nr:hypothetical protein F2Q69_00030873 [Brassica cretica]
MGEKQRKLLVLYASQTGNALDAAERIGREAERRGCPASIVSTDEFDPVWVNIPVWFHKSSLPAPPQSVPLILVGPGTRCAPFRGFIAERAVQAETSPTAPVINFFGSRNGHRFFILRLLGVPCKRRRC